MLKSNFSHVNRFFVKTDHRIVSYRLFELCTQAVQKLVNTDYSVLP
jgi:hypothetical protein